MGWSKAMGFLRETFAAVGGLWVLLLLGDLGGNEAGFAEEVGGLYL